MAGQEGISADQVVEQSSSRELATAPLDETLARLPECAEFHELVRRADLPWLLRRENLQTLFAPVNGFAKDVTGSADELAAIVSDHLISGAQKSYDLGQLEHVRTAGGSELTVTLSAHGVIRVGDAELKRTDIVCTNGILHIVSQLVRHPGA